MHISRTVSIEQMTRDSSFPKAPRWLHVLSHTDPRYGGLSAAVPALGASLRAKHGLDVSIAAFCHPDEHYRPIGFDGDRISFWPMSRRRWVLEAELRKTFEEQVQRADGLHIHGLWDQSTAIACRTARKLGRPYVLSAHGMLEPWALANKRLKKSIYAALVEKENVKHAACLHALTNTEAQQYRSFGAICPVTVVPNAVDVPSGLQPHIFLSRFPTLRGKRLVLFLSRLHPKKGLDLLIEAWSQVGTRHPDAHLVIAGPDFEGMQAKLTSDVERRGMNGGVCFTGMLQGPMKWAALAAAEAFVLPSYSEGLSMGLLEAMGVGTPVIATHACNMPEITSVDAGWEIEPRSDSLVSALSELLHSSPKQNRNKGSRGARLIATNYSTERIAHQMAELYDRLLRVPGASNARPIEEVSR